MIRLAESMADKAFTILAINVGEEKNRLPGFTKKMDEHMVVLLDTESETFERWKGIGLPSSFVLDPEGKIRHVAYGPVDWDRADIIKAFTTLINSHEKNNTSQ